MIKFYNREDKWEERPSLPMLSGIIDDSIPWEMSTVERIALIFILQHIKPRVSIEIGTRYGGSLQVLSKYSDLVYSIDSDPSVFDRLRSKYSNVLLITGKSEDVLPDLIEVPFPVPDFALVDGGHSEYDVQTDVSNLLRCCTICPMCIMIHDSSNPAVRKGVLNADWAVSKLEWMVDLDFVIGSLYEGEMWGGFALAMGG